MTIHIPDVSHYQAGFSLRPYPAAIAKATQGTGYTDPTYAGFKAQADELRIPFVAYHWVDGTDVGAQAAHAFSVVGRGVPLMWDAEAVGVTVPRLLALTAAYRALGGTVTLVYLPAWWWHDHMGAPDLRPLAAAGLNLVSSNYPTDGYADNGPGWLAYGGMTPVQWQYTSKPFDINAFKGSAAEYRALITGTPTTTTGTEDDMRSVWYLRSGLRVLRYDGTYWVQVGACDAAGRPDLAASNDVYTAIGRWGESKPNACDGPLKMDVRNTPLNPFAGPYLTLIDVGDTPPGVPAVGSGGGADVGQAVNEAIAAAVAKLHITIG